MNKSALLRSDFDYSLPENLIAQESSFQRDQSRLLVLDPTSGRFQDKRFSDLPAFLKSTDLLVMNDVKVIPVRIHAFRKTGGLVEVLFLNGWDSQPCNVLLKPARRIRKNEVLTLPGEHELLVKERDKQVFTAEFRGKLCLLDYLFMFGEMPLPPYIKRKSSDERSREDRERYQTIFAKNPGAIAAPTAGLHFSEDLMDRIKASGIPIVYLTLRVGWGTFKPVKTEDLSQHKMEEEWYSIPESTASAIREARVSGRRIVAIGTTTVRALESWAVDFPDFQPVTNASTRLFIFPGFSFKLTDALVTNFHLPGSTLLMLVCAFAGRELILSTYKHAIDMKYRFYSYGDAMFINRHL